MVELLLRASSGTSRQVQLPPPTSNDAAPTMNDATQTKTNITRTGPATATEGSKINQKTRAHNVFTRGEGEAYSLDDF